MTSEIQPLHQRALGSKTLLKKKLFESVEKSGNSNVFASPTDNMLSPCTEKLKNHKNRFFANQKVTKLNLKSSMSKEKGGSKLSSEIEGKDVDELLKARKPAKREEDEIDEDEMMKNINFDDI